MTVSIWRYAHLALAILTSLFLILASVTGAILAYDAAQENLQPYRAQNFNQITLSQALPELKKTFPEITEITIDDNRFVTLEGSDQDGNSVKAYVDPTTGKILGQPIIKSDFINWVTSLHRSLFLKETGRFIVGVVSILFLLIGVTGLILIVKRQQGIRHFFAGIKKDYFAQYFHVVSGRVLLLPIVLITLTATYLFLIRFDYIPKGKTEKVQHQATEGKTLSIAEFPIFKETKLADVKGIEFPFIEDDPEEFFMIKLKDKTISVNQINGEITEEQAVSKAEQYEALSLLLHTGRGNTILAIVLGISSIGVLLFIVTGFAITLRRTKNKIKNKYSTSDAEIVILVGSENGTTLGFANNIHQQFLSLGKKSFLTELNHYQAFPKAEHMIVMSATYGLGDAPSNANRFLKRLAETPQKQEVRTSVVAFGSKAYEDFCAYGELLQETLSQQAWSKSELSLYRVNDKSLIEFSDWARDWSYQSMIPLASAPALYKMQMPKLNDFEVVGRSEISEEAITFKILLKPKSNQKFQSGDLLAIYPDNDHKERFYSIGKVGGNLQLVVKLFEGGLGSNFLYHLKEGSMIKARIMENPEFHFPKKASKVAMIANGTGIAPFLGMIEENTQAVDAHLYAGFRYDNQLTKSYQNFAVENQEKGKLAHLHLAYSREVKKQYVMGLVKRDQALFTEILKGDGYIMICGALKMQHDIEKILEAICVENHLDFQQFKKDGRLLTDCY